MQTITAVKPVAPYVGGKKLLAKDVIAIIDSLPHTTYAEPFMGMGGVFFRRERIPKAEVINDLSKDVITLFRILQRHYPQFMDTLKFQITSRSEFERLCKMEPSTLTDLERAARFLYLQRTTFGGKVVGRVFGVDASGSARFNILKLATMLEDVHERLSSVVIECLDYAEFIKRYDKDGTLFYLDPPYYNTEGYYGKTLFRRDDYARLAEQLAGIKGKFLMSINDKPEVHKCFHAFYKKSVQTNYTVSSGKPKRAGELLVANVELEKEAK